MERLSDLRPLISLLRIVIILLAGTAISGCAVTGGALTTAADEGNTPAIRALLDRGVDVNERGGCGLWDVGGDFNATPLLCAAHGGHMESVKELIDRGADVNAKGSTFGRTPLTAAAYARHAGIAQLLVEKGADFDYAIANLQKHEQTKAGAVFLQGLAVKQRPSVPQPARVPVEAVPAAAAPVLNVETQRANDAYAEAKSADTFEAYEKFLKTYPSSEQRPEVLESMAGLIQKRNGAYADYRKYLSAYEDGLEFVPEKYRLDLTGPEGMRVHDITVLRKKGVEDNLIGAKIRSGKGKYKDFSFDEIDALKKRGVSALLIEAMIDSTTRAKREEEDLQKKKAMEDILAEIQRAQDRMEKLKIEQSSAPVPVSPVSVSAEQGQGSLVADTVKNCAAQIAALEACRHLPSLGAMVCKAAAKSQFPCE